MADIREILERSRTIAVVGLSRSAGKAAHDVPADLQRRGYRIIPVNPSVGEILGERAYPSLEEVPDPVDIVEVFRPAEEAPAIVEAAAAIGAKTVWLQLGLTSAEARRCAEVAHLDYVEDHCMSIELTRHSIPGPSAP